MRYGAPSIPLAHPTRRSMEDPRETIRPKEIRKVAGTPRLSYTHILSDARVHNNHMIGVKPLVPLCYKPASAATFLLLLLANLANSAYFTACRSKESRISPGEVWNSYLVYLRDKGSSLPGSCGSPTAFFFSDGVQGAPCRGFGVSPNFPFTHSFVVSLGVSQVS